MFPPFWLILTNISAGTNTCLPGLRKNRLLTTFKMKSQFGKQIGPESGNRQEIAEAKLSKSIRKRLKSTEDQGNTLWKKLSLLLTNMYMRLLDMCEKNTESEHINQTSGKFFPQLISASSKLPTKVLIE